MNQCATVVPAPLSSHVIARIAMELILAIAIIANAIANNQRLHQQEKTYAPYPP